MNDFQGLMLAEARRIEFIQEVRQNRLADFVTGKQKPQGREEFTAATTHSTGKSEGIRRLVPVIVGSFK